MAHHTASPRDRVTSFSDHGLQLWTHHDALQCCELGSTALQVSYCEMILDNQLPQILFSKSQKEVIPQSGSPQVPEPGIVQPTPIPSVQQRFRKFMWAFTSMVLFIILVVLVVFLLKLQRSGKNNASSRPSGVANSTSPSVGPSTPTGLSNGSSNAQLSYVRHRPCSC